jgi:hypothetical protein
MTDIDYDKKDQMERIQALVIPGEQLLAVYDMRGGGTGFIGITDLRLIFLDESFVRKSKALVTVPFTKITALGVEDTGRHINPFAANGKLTVVAGSRDWDFEFRSNDKAHRAYSLIMSNLLQTERKGLLKV